jgi:hypothetical protein
VDADAGPVHSGDRGGYLRPQRVEHGCHPGQAGPVRRPGGRRGRRTRWQHPAGEDGYYEAEGGWRRAAARYSGPARTSPLVRPPRPAFPSFHLGEIYRRMMTGHLRPRNRRV